MRLLSALLLASGLLLHACGAPGDGNTSQPEAELVTTRSALVKDTRTVEIALEPPLFIPTSSGGWIPLYTKRISIDDAPALAGRNLRSQLFPEVIGARTLETRDGTASVLYNPDACTVVDEPTLREYTRVPTSKLQGLVDNARGCSGDACPPLRGTHFRVNTLHVGRTLHLASELLDTANEYATRVFADSPDANSGLAETNLSAASQDMAGHVIAARRLKLGSLRLVPGLVYVFIATEEIALEGNVSTLHQDDLRGVRAMNVTLGGNPPKTYLLDHDGNHGLRAADGGTGDAGPTLILIAPRVTGSGDMGDSTIHLSGTHGQDGESLPTVSCYRSCKDPTEICAEGLYTSWDYDCYYGTRFDEARAGDGGKGGAGGNVFIVSDNVGPSGLAKLVNVSGAPGGRGGMNAKKQVIGSTWDVNDGFPLVEYGTRGASGKAGARGHAQALRLDGTLPALHYLLAGRAAERDMVAARRDALETDPRQPDGRGDRNRSKAIELYRGIVDYYCDEVGAQYSSKFSSSLVAKRRVHICAEARARLHPLERGQNVFGLSHDLDVYLDPSQIEDVRDQLLTRFEREVVSPFEAALQSSSQALSSAGLEAMVAQAENAQRELAIDMQIAQQEADGAQQEANTALSRMQRTQAAVHERQQAINRHRQSMEKALEPPPQSVWGAIKGLVGKLATIVKVAVSVVKAVYGGIDGIGGAVDGLKGLAKGTITFDDVDRDAMLAEGVKHPEAEWKPDGFKNLKRDLDRVTEGFESFWESASAVPDDVESVFAGFRKDREEADVLGLEDSVATEALMQSPSIADKAQAICGQQGAAFAASLERAVSLKNAIDSVPSSAVRDKGKAVDDIEVILELTRANDQLSAQACTYFEDAALARKRAEIAVARRDLAALRAENAASQAEWLSELFSNGQAHARDRARALCWNAQSWEEQILMLDFLAARALAFVQLEEPKTDSARGNFHRPLLDPAERSAVRNENYVASLALDGWSNDSRWLYHTYRREDEECDGPSQQSGVRARRAAQCAAQRAMIGSLLDTGYASFNLEEGPNRFDILAGELPRGRVTRAELNLRASVDGELRRELDGTMPLARISHEALATFAVGPVQNRSFEQRRFDLDSTSVLCQALESASERFLSGSYDLGCDTLGRHFLSVNGATTPPHTKWLRDVGWTADWTLFGTSARGQWSVDLRPVYRELNRKDFCYSELAYAHTSGEVSERAEDCLGGTFSPVECVDEEGEECPVPLYDRVVEYMEVCGRYVRELDHPDNRTLVGSPPLECDRVCGPRCQAVKKGLSAAEFNIETRTWAEKVSD